MKLKGALSNEQALRNMKGVIRQKTLDLLNNFGAVSGAELAAINAETAEYNASTNSGPPADQPADDGTPNAPTNLVATPSNTSVTITFTNTGPTPEYTYILFGSPTTYQVSTYSASLVTIDNLAPGPYNLALIATNAAGSSSPSAYVQFTIGFNPAGWRPGNGIRRTAIKVVYGNGTFLALGGDVILGSGVFVYIDDNSWGVTSFPSVGQGDILIIRDIAFSASTSTFMCVGAIRRGGDYIPTAQVYDQSNETWREVFDTYPFGVLIVVTAYTDLNDDTYWLVGGALPASNHMVFSFDGTTWAHATTTLAVGDENDKLSIATDGTTIVVGGDDTNAESMCYTSFPLTNLSVFMSIDTQQDRTMSVVYSDNGGWAAIGVAADSNNTVLASNDGQTWTPSTYPLPVQPLYITYSDDVAVWLVGGDGTNNPNDVSMYYLSDLRFDQWTETPLRGVPATFVAYMNNTLFVGTGRDTQPIYYSENGTLFTGVSQAVSGLSSVVGIAQGGGKLMAVGSSGNNTAALSYNTTSTVPFPLPDPPFDPSGWTYDDTSGPLFSSAAPVKTLYGNGIIMLLTYDNGTPNVYYTSRGDHTAFTRLNLDSFNLTVADIAYSPQTDTFMLVGGADATTTPTVFTFTNEAWVDISSNFISDAGFNPSDNSNGVLNIVVASSDRWILVGIGGGEPYLVTYTFNGGIWASQIITNLISVASIATDGQTISIVGIHGGLSNTSICYTDISNTAGFTEASSNIAGSIFDSGGTFIVYDERGGWLALGVDTSENTIAHSSDGQYWEVTAVIGGNNTFGVYRNGMWVVNGSDGTVLVSSTGVGFAQYTVRSGSVINSIEYDRLKNVWFAGLNTTPSLVYTSDITGSWSDISSTGLDSTTGIINAYGEWVAVGIPSGTGNGLSTNTT